MPTTTNTKRVQCPCGAVATYDAATCSSLADIGYATGFRSVMDTTNGLTAIWLCPPCRDRAEALAKELLAILKSPHFYFPNLLR